MRIILDLLARNAPTRATQNLAEVAQVKFVNAAKGNYCPTSCRSARVLLAHGTPLAIRSTQSQLDGPILSMHRIEGQRYTEDCLYKPLNRMPHDDAY